MAERRLPLQLPTAVLPQIKQFEHLLEFHHLTKYEEMKFVLVGEYC